MSLLQQVDDLQDRWDDVAVFVRLVDGHRSAFLTALTQGNDGEWYCIVDPVWSTAQDLGLQRNAVDGQLQRLVHSLNRSGAPFSHAAHRNSMWENLSVGPVQPGPADQIRLGADGTLRPTLEFLGWKEDCESTD